MAKKQFPITTRVGATAIRIYKSPLRVIPDDRKSKLYESFVVVHYLGGKRIRTRFKTLALAETEVERIRTLLLNQDLAAFQLTGQERLIYARANEIAKAYGITLDTLASQYGNARSILGDATLEEAAQFFDRFGRSVKAKKTVPEVVEELIATLKADGKSSYHIGDMERRLTSFATAFPKSILEIQTKEFAEWLRNLKGKDKKGGEILYAPKTRNHYRNAVVQMFNFARDHGYLPKGIPTEVEAVKPLDVVTSENEILTVDQLATLLEHAKPRVLIPMAIKAFTGIRTEEMLRLKWEHLNFKTQYVILQAEVTKTKQRRIIPMSDNLVAWLEMHKKEAGRICDRWRRPQALSQAFERHGTRHGIHVGANKFRNSYISYRVAVTHDVQRVALESGNSPRVIQREYLELATEEDGKAWFAIMPTKHSASLRPKQIVKDPKRV
jgi:integrase